MPVWSPEHRNNYYWCLFSSYLFSSIMNNEAEKTEPDKKRPYLKERIYASFIDGLLIVILMVVFSSLFFNDEDASSETRMIAFLFTYLLEPLCIASLGGSIGHYIMGIRVKRASNEYKNIWFPMALLRSFTKYMLGFLSFIWMTARNKNRAIHDFVAGSVVIYK